MKSKYLDMIVEAVHILGERKGSSAQAIWKHLQTKHAESVRDQKIFRVQLKRVAADGKYVVKSGAARYKLTSSFRQKLLKWAAKADGSEKKLPPMAMEHAMTTKTKHARKAAKAMKKAAMSKSAKGKKALAKSKKLAASKKKAAKTKAKAAAKKAKSKNKSKSTKAAKDAKKRSKSKGSTKNKKRVGTKAKDAKKKVAASKKKNQRGKAPSKSKGKIVKGKAGGKAKGGARGKAARSKAASKAGSRAGSKTTSPKGRKPSIGVSPLGSSAKKGSSRKSVGVSRRSKGIKK